MREGRNGQKAEELTGGGDGGKEQEQEETPQECEIVLYSRLGECEILTVSVRMLCVHKLDITCQMCPSAAET